MNKNFNTPILFLIFNRPDTTQKVFDVIRETRPKKLFIAADGPRAGIEDDKKKCEATRNIIKQVDWDCEVKTLFRDENLGCGKAVSGAITWFFENVEEGIILEDDCCPNKAFFAFCEQMLQFYKDDERIMHISGDNYQFGKQRGDGDYYFSKLNHVWGWATWRRAWKYYDLEMLNLEKFIKNKYVESIFFHKNISKKWINNFLNTKNGKIDTWDYQWTYAMWIQNGLAILPNKNLVKNIGICIDATHTKNPNKLFEINNDNTERNNNFIIQKHPTFVIRDYNADKYSQDVMQQNIIKRILNKVKKFNIN